MTAIDGVTRMWRLPLTVAWAAILGSLGLGSGLQLEPTAWAASPPGRSRTYLQVRQVQRLHTDNLLAMRDVVGTATGLGRDGKFAVKVFARRAGAAGIPAELDGVPVVVEATGEFYAYRRPGYHRPRRPQGQRPSVAVVSPADGTFVGGEVEIVAVARDDDGIQSVAFSIDGIGLGTDTAGADGWSWVWDTSQFAEGLHLVAVTAADTTGQTGHAQSGVVVDNLPGPFSPDGRPTPIGVSTGNANECSSGTITCRVRDAQGNIYVLSNNHVYARLNQAQIGESILQPGLADTDCLQTYSDQVIGLLADFVPINFSLRGSNRVDAALAVSTLQDLGRATPGNGYGRPKSQVAATFVEQSVQKYGRTTQLTFGYVSGVEATVVVNYGNRNARFTGQILVSGPQGFLEPGDSGALLVTYDPDDLNRGGREPVGLLFAGNGDGSTAIANPIQDVLDAFQVTIDGE